MSGHTPGPWALQMAEDCQGRQLDEMVKWVVTANANDLWVTTGPTWDAEHDEESIANAHLIAAAPLMLEALQDLTKLAIGPAGGVTMEMKREAVAKALYAIAAARGAKS